MSAPANPVRDALDVSRQCWSEAHRHSIAASDSHVEGAIGVVDDRVCDALVGATRVRGNKGPKLHICAPVRAIYC
jgi:hypothetical protein